MANGFRETMWFKMGEQDLQPPIVQEDGDEAEASSTAAMLPIEDRYGAHVSAHDTATFGLHTGMTDRMKAMNVVAVAGTADDATMSALVREMKRGKRVLAIGAGIAAVCAAFVVYMM